VNVFCQSFLLRSVRQSTIKVHVFIVLTCIFYILLNQHNIDICRFFISIVYWTVNTYQRNVCTLRDKSALPLSQGEPIYKSRQKKKKKPTSLYSAFKWISGFIKLFCDLTEFMWNHFQLYYWLEEITYNFGLIYITIYKYI
jgi:hypothetical protein